jgi:N-acetylglutamate synthase-like GNAT family acetyltransferase
MNIAYLSDHKEAIPLLAQWFYKEWAYLNPGKTLADVEQLIGERTNTDKIPIALVAFDNHELLGTVCLKVHDMDTRLDLSPWLAGLYVAAPRRRQGIGASLVAAIENKAIELGIKQLYLHTPGAESFYAKLGWQVNERPQYHGYLVSLMQKRIVL